MASIVSTEGGRALRETCGEEDALALVRPEVESPAESFDACDPFNRLSGVCHLSPHRSSGRWEYAVVKPASDAVLLDGERVLSA